MLLQHASVYTPNADPAVVTRKHWRGWGWRTKAGECAVDQALQARAWSDGRREEPGTGRKGVKLRWWRGGAGMVLLEQSLGELEARMTPTVVLARSRSQHRKNPAFEQVSTRTHTTTTVRYAFPRLRSALQSTQVQQDNRAWTVLTAITIQHAHSRIKLHVAQPVYIMQHQTFPFTIFNLHLSLQ